ncbi:FAST kinase domain-containing protein 4 [Emydura macquarii macquarii]|uniref:FAST kinase domain-containing protein 4 n=1 Tax=Emydura macquarii macquarii TaxID=1129001 RepID=UPI00352A176C
MAARLVQRCCRQLFGVSTCAPLAASASLLIPACKTVIARPPQAALASLHMSSLSRQTDELSFKEQLDHRYLGNSKINKLIESASSPEDLFQVAALHSLNGNQASKVVIQLSRIAVEKKLETKNILKDNHFRQVLSIIDNKLSQIWNGTLLSLLKSLHSLGQEMNKRELRLVKQEIHWRLKRLSVKQIASLAKQLTTFKQTEDDCKMLRDCMKQLELRWTEIGDTKTLVAVMTVRHLSQTLMHRLEDKALELAEEFNAEDIRKVMLALVLQNWRSVPLLRAISYHLVQKQFAFSTDSLVDIVFAYGKLNFHHNQVFQKIASQLQGRLPEMAYHDIISCLRSFSYLKWLHLLLFETFTQTILNSADRFTVLQLCNIILAFAHLNFQPSKGESFYNMVHEKLNNQLDSIDPYMLIEVVWSLCVLQQVKTPYLQRVLTPQFYSPFLDRESIRRQNYMLRLLQINATARLESPNYPGPFLSPEALRDMWQSEDWKLSPAQCRLQEALQVVAGDEGNRRFNVQTIYGWLLDAEMVLNSNNQPLPVKDFASPYLLHSESKTPLPPDARRIAFLLWEFPNFSSRSKELLGRFVMARRHVQAAGFLIVDVPYYEFLDLNTEAQKATYLKDKMNKLMAEEMAK